MRILLATAGSRGDVEPFAALADRAQAAGHDVRIVAPDNSGVDMVGLDVASMGIDFTRVIEGQGVSLVAAMRNYRSEVRPVMRGVIVGAARAALEFEPEVIVYHPKVLSAPLVADALGVPHVPVELVPALTPTADFPAPGTLARGFRPLNRMTYTAVRAASAMFGAELDIVRTLIGTTRRKTSAPQLTLVPISPQLLPRPADWPTELHLTGPWSRRDSTAILAPEIEDFVADGPFIYAGFGSMRAGDATARGRTIVDAARARGARCLVATGLGGITVPGDRIGPDVLVVKDVPHRAVMPSATAAIHHGGAGTVHTAVGAGTLSVIVPFIADQPFWGALLHSTGLGPAPVSKHALSVRSLTAALDEADRCRPRVAEVSAAMSAEDGTLTAVALLNRLR